VIAQGAGWEMRRALGTAVFSGMLGVTIFGIFLTPVFFYVIQWLGERSVWSYPAVRWTGSILLGALMCIPLGMRLWLFADGFDFTWPWLRAAVCDLAFLLGLTPGVLVALLVLGVHRRGQSRTA